MMTWTLHRKWTTWCKCARHGFQESLMNLCKIWQIDPRQLWEQQHLFWFSKWFITVCFNGFAGKKKKKNRNIKSFLVWFNISVLNNGNILSAELHKVVSVKTFAGNMCVCSVKSHCMLLLNDTVSAENPFDSVSWHLLVWINMYNLSLCYFDLCQGWYLSIFLCTLT